MSWSVHQIIDHELWTDNIGHTTTFHSPNTTSLGATYKSCQLCASLNRKHIVHKMRIRVLYIQILHHMFPSNPFPHALHRIAAINGCRHSVRWRGIHRNLLHHLIQHRVGLGSLLHRLLLIDHLRLSSHGLSHRLCHGLSHGLRLLLINHLGLSHWRHLRGGNGPSGTLSGGGCCRRGRLGGGHHSLGVLHRLGLAEHGPERRETAKVDPAGNAHVAKDANHDDNNPCCHSGSNVHFVVRAIVIIVDTAGFPTRDIIIAIITIVIPFAILS